VANLKLVVQMQLNKIDFSELEIKEIGSWPLVLRVAVIVAASFVAVVLVFFLVLEGQMKDLDTANKQELAKRDEFKEKYNLSANLDAYQKQMLEMNQAYQDLSKALPSDSGIPDLIENISKLAETNHLKYDSIKLGESKNVSGFYKELPIELNLTGKYHNFARFIQDLSKLPRIVTLHDFVITKDDADKDKNSGGMLKMTLKVKTYWLTSDSENATADKTGAGTPGAPGAPAMPPEPPGASTRPGPPRPAPTQEIR